MSYIYNIHARLRNSMECLLTNPDRNAALWNIYMSFLVQIFEDEFPDPDDRKLFKRIKHELEKRNTAESSIVHSYFRMRKEASGKISMDIFELYQSIHEKYQALTPHKA